MPIIPNIPKVSTSTQKCAKCGKVKLTTQFSKTKNEFFTNGLLPICNECVADNIE